MSDERTSLLEKRLKGTLISGMISKTAQTENADNFQMISIEKLIPFFDHPFQPYGEEELEDLVESIKEIGIMHPIVVRPANDGQYEILSGHNRTQAAKRARLIDIPAKVLNVDDDAARMIVTDTNLKQRQSIRHSDKARAYKMQLDALKNQGKTRAFIDLIEQANEGCPTGPQVDAMELEERCPTGSQVKSRDVVAAINKTSATQISRYIRLNYLCEGLLQKIDAGEISVRAGATLSYLSDELQGKINGLLIEDKRLSITSEAATKLRNLEKEGRNQDELTMNVLTEIIMGKTEKNPIELSPKKAKPFSTAIKAVEKQFKQIDPQITAKIDQNALEGVVVAAVQQYLDQLG